MPIQLWCGHPALGTTMCQILKRKMSASKHTSRPSKQRLRQEDHDFEDCLGYIGHPASKIPPKRSFVFVFSLLCQQYLLFGLLGSLEPSSLEAMDLF